MGKNTHLTGAMSHCRWQTGVRKRLSRWRLCGLAYYPCNFMLREQESPKLGPKVWLPLHMGDIFILLQGILHQEMSSNYIVCMSHYDKATGSPGCWKAWLCSKSNISHFQIPLWNMLHPYVERQDMYFLSFDWNSLEILAYFGAESLAPSTSNIHMGAT